MSPGGKNIQHLICQNSKRHGSQSCYSGKQDKDILSMNEGPGESLIVQTFRGIKGINFKQ